MRDHLSDAWTIYASSAEDALLQGLERITVYGQREESRAGPVLVAPCPVLILNHRPEHRVIRAPWRDANPFFHLVEAAWMLAGRDDAASLLPYVRRFAEFAEPGGFVHGAYGQRWRSHFGLDQLASVIEQLRVSPGSRQAVIAMWDPSIIHDLPQVGGMMGAEDLSGVWRDRPCNTHIYLRVRNVEAGHWRETSTGESGKLQLKVLDLTVLCRSNDLVWGAHGANIVHFSFLHEYLASATGCGLGILRQFAHNYHVYVSELRKLEARAGYLERSEVDSYPTAMGSAADVDADLPRLWPLLDDLHRGELPTSHGLLTDVVKSPFAQTVLGAAVAHFYHRSGSAEMARHVLDWHMPMTEWRAACLEWLARRAAK